MSVLITGPGRGGTNWTTELVRASGCFDFIGSPEDRKLLKREEKLPERYGTKLSTEWFDWEGIDKLVEDNEGLKIIFSIRHPVSLCMAKIVRGQPSHQGGDGSHLLAPDGTVDGSIESVIHAYSVYINLKDKYKDRVMFVRLEDMIRDIDSIIKEVCLFLGIEPNASMNNAHKNNRNKHHQKRYGTSVDKSQAEIHKNWKTAYGRFFADRENDIKYIEETLRDISLYFGY